MRNFFILGLFFTAFLYALPILLDAPGDETAASASQDALRVHAESTAPVQHSTDSITVQIDGKAQQMDLEDYVAGVVAAEISPNFPAEALKAQAVAARTYAVYKQSNSRPAAHPDADVCDDYKHCAAYTDLTVQAADWGRQAKTYENAILQAVHATSGELILYEDKPIIAVFCAASGAKTEAAADVWGSAIPYLVNVDSPGGDACPKYKGDVTFSLTDFRTKIAKLLPSANLTGAPQDWFKSSVRSPAGGIQTVKLGGVQVTGADLRQALGLNSTNFTLRFSDDSITFQTTGYGHGVGLSQYGAKYMADHGKTYKEILEHYYPGTVVKKIGDR